MGRGPCSGGAGDGTIAAHDAGAGIESSALMHLVSPYTCEASIYIHEVGHLFVRRVCARARACVGEYSCACLSVSLMSASL